MILLAAAPDGPVDPEVLTRLLTTVERMYETREAEFAGTTVALPGVHEAVDALDAAGVLQTVVTGNMASIARRKLRAVGLDERLRLDLGAYGDDHADRAALMAAAVERLAVADVTAGAARAHLDHRRHAPRPRRRPRRRRPLRARRHRDVPARRAGRARRRRRPARPHGRRRAARADRRRLTAVSRRPAPTATVP